MLNLKEIIHNAGVRFVLRFIILFTVFYYFNLFYIGITGKGGFLYISFLDHYLNYIKWWRDFLLHASSWFLSIFGYETIVSSHHLKLVNGARVGLVYSCLGYGIISFFTAFVIAYPTPLKAKLKFFFLGVCIINFLNIMRICAVLLAYSYYRTKGGLDIDHHLLFNSITYTIIFLMIYFWLNSKMVKSN